MGFISPQIVIDARKHGVDVRPVDVNESGWDHQLEEKAGTFFALRLGFRQVKASGRRIWKTAAGKKRALHQNG